MSGDEVVGRGDDGGGRLPVSHVGQADVHAIRISTGAAEKGVEHGGAGVDGVDADGGIGTQQAGGEAAVTVAEDEGTAGLGKTAQEGAPGEGEPGAEAEELHPAIEAGESVEIWGPIHLRRRASGVSSRPNRRRRRAMGVRRARERSSKARSRAPMAPASRSAAKRGRVESRSATRVRAATARQQAGVMICAQFRR